METRGCPSCSQGAAPASSVVLEHMTTMMEVDFVEERHAPERGRHHHAAARARQPATTCLAGGIRPHFYCSTNPQDGGGPPGAPRRRRPGRERAFQGTDSAPHARPNKESACGCAGVRPAHAAIELYAEALRRRRVGQASASLAGATARRSTDCRARRSGPTRRSQAEDCGSCPSLCRLATMSSCRVPWRRVLQVRRSSCNAGMPGR